MDEEALFLRFPLRVAIRKRFERSDPAVARLSDRREEKRLLDPAARIGHEVHACDERRVVRGWSSGQVCRAGKEMRRTVLKGAKEAPVVDLMEALKQSVAQARKDKPSAAKPKAKKAPAKKRAAAR